MLIDEVFLSNIQALSSPPTTILHPDIVPFEFRWSRHHGGDTVYLVGSFINWDLQRKIELKRDENYDFSVLIYLEEGEHQFKFLVDGEWRYSPDFNIVRDGVGNVNNHCRCQKVEFSQKMPLISSSATPRLLPDQLKIEARSTTYMFVTLKMLVKASDRTNSFTFKDIGEGIFGKYFTPLLELFIICYTTGSCIGCMVVLGDVVPLVFHTFIPADWLIVNRRIVITLLVVFIVLPLSSLPKLDKLRFTSFFAMFSVLMLLIVVYWRYFSTYINLVNPGVNFINISLGPFIAFPLLTASFCCHYNVLNIYKEMEDRSYGKMSTVIDTTSIAASLLYTTFGIFGYASFFNDTKSDILNNYPVNDLMALIARGFQAIVILFSYPVICFALRNGIETMLFTRFNYSVVRLATLSFVICSCHLIVALLVEDLGYVISIAGAVFGTSIIYILPGLFYLVVCVDNYLSYKIILPILSMIIGFAVMILGVGGAIADIFHII